MKKILVTLLAALGLHLGARAEEGYPWDAFPVSRLTDMAALQNGAKLFVNYCLNCHSAAYMRYNRMRDIGLTEDQIKKNLLFATEKVGDTMKVSLDPKQANDLVDGGTLAVGTRLVVPTAARLGSAPAAPPVQLPSGTPEPVVAMGTDTPDGAVRALVVKRRGDTSTPD